MYNLYKMYRSLSVVLFIVSVSAVVSGNIGVQKSITYKFDSVEGDFYATKLKECTKPGPMCDGCKTLYECIQIGNDFLQQELEVCADGTTCLETPTTANCTKGPNPGCDADNYKFTCHQVGLFPDPFNCKKYHLCAPDGDESNNVNPDSVSLSCLGEFYYDARTNLCRKKLVNNSCPVVASPCTALGQVGLILNNPALYYVCLKQGTDVGFFPNVFACPNNKEYDLISHSCKDPTPATGIKPDGKCEKIGLFYDPTSCFYYYQCAAVGGNPTRRLCATKLHFDSKVQKCVDFTCANLEK